VADFETKLRWLSERGNPVGAEELIERIEADLAGDPLVVVAKRRKGTLMTKTQQSLTTRQPSRYRGPGWAVTAFVAVLALGALYVAFSGDRDEVANTPPPPTGEVAPTQMEAIRQTVAAANSQDEETLRRLFAVDAEVNPGVWGSISVTTPNFASAWSYNLDAWGFEGEVVGCSTVGAGVDCEVRARWHTLSAESVEEWSFVFDGEVIRTLTISRVDPNPSDRVLPLGISDLDDWENWLKSTDPATARRLIPDAETPETLRLIVPFLRYDATFADEIGESIKKYLVEG
jgi:hypothetical protein